MKQVKHYQSSEWNPKSKWAHLSPMFNPRRGRPLALPLDAGLVPHRFRGLVDLAVGSEDQEAVK
jgi:hypothetical protein